MLQAIAKSLFGSANDRYLKNLQHYVDAINALEPRKPRGHRETPFIPQATPTEGFDQIHEDKSN